MQVDIWSDVLCPMCFIGKRSFEMALARFEHRDAVEIRWRAFELDPQMAREPHLTLIQQHHRDFGGSARAAEERMAQIAAIALRAGLHYDLARAMPVNSFDAHRLGKLADSVDLGEAMRERLMLAYTCEGAVITDADTLAGLAEQVGIDPDAVRKMLVGDDFTADVHADEEQARQRRITGVPTFVVDGSYTFSGLREPDDYLRSLRGAVASA
ncbi:DsbA family oxidoreductase [Nocardia noduli]|uniref:DsbA family oxidoreductase n=1 Tax=Nocardia noduli TaxID=2815722 RepID=UPI001C231735|nr:DsbA family oxidoreductase [Nocardia noduli]